MIDQATITRILDTSNIVDVVSDFISLKKRGANHMACCPFHDEKTPSFVVSASKGIYKCFGCGKAGNAVSFVMEHEHVSYVEALKYLGKKYGIEIEERELTEEELQINNQRESLMVVSAYAQEYFLKTLWNDPEGKAIGLSYLRERGFRDKTVKNFQLGYSPDSRTAFSNKALHDGYKKEFLVAAGLSIEKRDTLIDRFSGRVIFPIHSLSGRVIAFGGRTLKQDKTVAKYLNSPETTLYSKSHTLYGIFFAKQSIVRLQKCYLVEGYTDVISMHQAGIENVVASSGTALTVEQIRLIKRFTPNITLLYDGDTAGINASLRGIDMLLEEGLNVKVALFPDGDDPDSFSRKHSASEFEAFLKNAEEDFISFKVKLLTREASQDPIKRAHAITDIVHSISVIPDTILRTVYVKESSRLMNIEEEVLQTEITKLRRKKLYGETLKKPDEYRKPLPIANTANETTTATEKTPPLPDTGNEDYEASEKEIIYYLLKFGDRKIFTDTNGEQIISVAEYLIADLHGDDLELKNLQYRKIIDEYELALQLTPDERLKHFINHPNPGISEIVINMLSENYSITIKRFGESGENEETKLQHDIPRAVLIYKSKILKRNYAELSEQIRTAQQNHDAGQIPLLIERLRTLQNLRNVFAKELNRLTT